MDIKNDIDIITNSDIFKNEEKKYYHCLEIASQVE